MDRMKLCVQVGKDCVHGVRLDRGSEQISWMGCIPRLREFEPSLYAGIGKDDSQNICWSQEGTYIFSNNHTDVQKQTQKQAGRQQ